MGIGRNISEGSFLVVLGIVFTAAIVVAAAVLVSNVLVVNTSVKELPITVAQVPSDKNEYNELSSEVYKGATYETAIRMTSASSEQINPVEVIFVITKAGINETDVVVKYYEDEGTSPGWRVLNMVDEGDRLVGHFGPADGFPVAASYNATTDLQVTFNCAGDYKTSVYAQLVDAA